MDFTTVVKDRNENVKGKMHSDTQQIHDCGILLAKTLVRHSDDVYQLIVETSDSTGPIMRAVVVRKVTSTVYDDSKSLVPKWISDTGLLAEAERKRRAVGQG